MDVRTGNDRSAVQFQDWFGADPFDPTFVKALVRFNPAGDPDLNRRQAERLAHLSEWLRVRDRTFLFELLVPASTAQPDSFACDQRDYLRNLRPRLVVGLHRFDGHPPPERMPIMETMERNKRRARRSFTPEFKAEIVERCLAGDRTIAQVARDFDLTESAVRRWVAQAEIDAGERPGLSTEEREELARLRRENRRLQADVDLLKRATAFFAKETR